MLKYLVLSLDPSLQEVIIKSGFPYQILTITDDHLTHISLSECLAIVDTDFAIEAFTARHIAMPTIGVLNSVYADQQLYGATYLAEYVDVIDQPFLELVYNRYHKVPLVVGETSRTLIKELTPDDCDALYDLYDSIGSNPNVEPLPADRDETRNAITQYVKNGYGFFGYGLWGVFLKSTQQLIGYCGIEQHTKSGKTYFELSYMIHKAYQRQNLGYEVCQKIITIAESTYELPELALFTSKENTASIQLAKKLGFRQLPFLINERVSFIMNISNERKD